MYEYNALVTDVYDGDTVTVTIDLGMNIFLKDQKIRLLGIDAPEVRGIERPHGLTSRDFLRELIMNEWVILKTYKDRKGKYGRWIGRIIYKDTDVNSLLIEKGLAQLYVEG